jgi:hypothetical protein
MPTSLINERVGVQDEVVGCNLSTRMSARRSHRDKVFDASLAVGLASCQK